MELQDKVEKLVSNFVIAAKMHHQATIQGNWLETNRQANNIRLLFEEITKIGESARKVLLSQIDHEDPAVASMAAVYSLEYNPERAMKALHRIAAEPGIVGFGAKQALARWDEGAWQLE